MSVKTINLTPCSCGGQPKIKIVGDNKQYFVCICSKCGMTPVNFNETQHKRQDMKQLRFGIGELIMIFDFDKAFHKQMTPIPKDCPCRECDEPKYGVDNPYYRSAKCNECKVYKDWRNNNG